MTGPTNGNRPASFLTEKIAERINAETPEPPDRFAGMSPPNNGRFPLPHILTFQGMLSTIAKVYRASDEALQKSYEESRFMLNDVGILECLHARQRSVALLDWTIEPEDDEHSAEDKELCAQLTKIVRRIKQFTEYRRCLQNAIWFGRYAIQHSIRPVSIGGRMRHMPAPDPVRRANFGWEPIHGDKLVFRHWASDFEPDQFAGQVGIRLGFHYSGTGVEPERVETTDRGSAYFLNNEERNCLIIHRHMIEDGAFESAIDAGMINGVGIRSRIFWEWYQKQEAMAFLMEYVERTAGGIELWYYDEGNPRAKTDTEAAARNRLSGGRSIILVPRPRGEDAMAYGVEVIEPGVAGVEQLKDLLTTYFGHRIKRYILGQVLSSEAEATGLGSGVAELHLDTFMQIIRYDASSQEESITEDLVNRIKDWNFPRARNIGVRFKLRTTEPDIEKKMEGWGKAYDMGCRLKERDVMEAVGASMPGPEDRVLQNPQFAQAAMQQQGGPYTGPGPGGMPGQKPPTPEETAQEMTDGIMQNLYGDAEPGQGVTYVNEAGEWQERELPAEEADTGDRLRAGKYAKSSDEAAAETDANPSDEQKAAGNYRKGQFSWNGLTVAIENPKGGTRSGKSRDGQEWSVTMPAHYGYIRRTEGKDGDHVDCFIGPRPESEIIYVIDQLTIGGARFDEHKVMLGFDSMREARDAYLGSRSDDGDSLIGDIVPMTARQFCAWLDGGDTTKPIGPQVSKYRNAGMVERYSSWVSTAELVRAGIDRYAAQRSFSWDEDAHPREPDGTFAEKDGKSGGEEPEVTAKSKGEATRQGARRSRSAVHFEKPIIGPSGASLTSYEWKWTWEEGPEHDDPVRVSDWQEAETNEQTGRDIVHHFHITTKDGKSHTVSLETAIRLMGFEDNAAGLGKVKNLAMASMRLAEAQRSHEALKEKASASKWEIDRSQREVNDLRDRVDFLAGEARRAAKTGKNPAEHYRDVARKLHAIRRMFHTVGKNEWQNPKLSDIAKASGKSREEQQSLYDQAEALYRNLAVAGVMNVLGEKTAKTPLPDETPEKTVFGRKVKAVPAWSDQKMRNWFASNGEQAEAAIDAAHAWLRQHHVDYSDMAKREDFAMLADDTPEVEKYSRSWSRVARYDAPSDVSEIPDRPSWLQPKQAGESQPEKRSRKGGKGGSWVKVGGGASAFVGPDGTIKKGCPGLKGHTIAEITDEPEESRQRREAKQAHAEARGVKGHQVSATEAKSWETGKAQDQHRAAKRAAQFHEVPVASVLRALPDAHALRVEQWEQREKAKTHARRASGLNASNLGKIENAYRDYSTVPGFDEAATGVAYAFPELFSRSEDIAADVWELIREGAVPQPRMHDEDTATMAAEMVRDSGARSWEQQPEYHDATGDDGFGDDSFDPDRFRRVGGAQRYSWEESKHPRGQPENAGEFVESKGPQKTSKPKKSHTTGKPLKTYAYDTSLSGVEIVSPSKLSHSSKQEGWLDDDNVDGMVSAIKAGKRLDPVVAIKSTGEVIDGNHRLAAASVARLNVPVMFIDDDEYRELKSEGYGDDELTDTLVIRRRIEATESASNRVFDSDVASQDEPQEDRFSRIRILIDRYAAKKNPAAGQKSLWHEEDHPRDEAGKFSAKEGDVHELPAMGGRGAMKVKVTSVADGKVGIGFHDSPHTWTHMPEESFPHFLQDMTGKLNIPGESGNPHIDRIASGEAKLLGKGDDGLVFDTGDGKVTKVSTTVPFQPMNPFHRTPEQARQMATDQFKTAKELHEAGVPGIPKMSIRQHGDRMFTIRENLQIPESLTAPQLAEVRDSLRKMHDAGYSLNDEIQVGIGSDGKVYHFDMGKAAKVSHPDDVNDDQGRLDRVAAKHGLPRLSIDPHKEWKGHQEAIGKRGGKDALQKSYRETMADSINRLRDQMIAENPADAERIHAEHAEMMGESTSSAGAGEAGAGETSPPDVPPAAPSGGKSWAKPFRESSLSSEARVAGKTVRNATGKEPWQLTQDEFTGAVDPSNARWRIGYDDSAQHREWVQAAIIQRPDDVPDNVLMEYADSEPSAMNLLNERRAEQKRGAADKPAETTPKEPWQMTREEFVQAGGYTGGQRFFKANQAHSDAIRKAVDDGKKIPDEVLADFPDVKREIEKHKKDMELQKRINDDYWDSDAGHDDKWREWHESDAMRDVHNELARTNPEYQSLEKQLMNESDYEGDDVDPAILPAISRMELLAMNEANRRGITTPKGTHKAAMRARKAASDLPAFQEPKPEPSDMRKKAQERAKQVQAEEEKSWGKGGAAPKEQTSGPQADHLFRRSGSQFSNLQRAVGAKNPAMGEKGAGTIRKFLKDHPAGPVVESLLGVDGSESGYDDNGFANRGQDAFRREIDGKFTKEQLNAAATWLGETYSESNEEIGHVNQNRWLRGTVRTATPKDAPKPQNSSTPGDEIQKPFVTETGERVMMTESQWREYKTNRPKPVNIGGMSRKDAEVAVAQQSQKDREAVQAAVSQKPTVPGTQAGLFNREELATGQKQLFNVVRPQKGGKKPGGLFNDITAGLDAAVRAKLAEKETLSPADLSLRLQGESIEGQKELFSRQMRDSICRYMRAGREASS